MKTLVLSTCWRLGWVVLCCGCGAAGGGGTGSVPAPAVVPAGAQSIEGSQATSAPAGKAPLPVAPVKAY
jgi:hypothetical protein